jgi:phage tail-like protein
VAIPAAPFPGYAFVLYVNSPGGGMKPLGGFSESVGLLNKIQGLHTVGDVTMKRGIVNASGLSEWIAAARAKGPTAMRQVTVTQRSAGNMPLKSWKLANTTPAKYTGPTLSGKGNDVALEELVLTPERIEIIPPH